MNKKQQTYDLIDSIIDEVINNLEYEVEVQGYQDYGVVASVYDRDKLRTKLTKLLWEK